MCPSVIRGVERASVGEEQMPAVVAAEGFQIHQRFITGLGPALTRAFVAHLILSAGRFHRPAAQGLALLCGRPVVEALAAGLQAGGLARHLLSRATPSTRSRSCSNSAMTSPLASAFCWGPFRASGGTVRGRRAGVVLPDDRGGRPPRTGGGATGRPTSTAGFRALGATTLPRGDYPSQRRGGLSEVVMPCL